MFKVNDKNTRTKHHWRRSGVFINFEHISHLFLVFLLLILNKQMLAGQCAFAKGINCSFKITYNEYYNRVCNLFQPDQVAFIDDRFFQAGFSWLYGVGSIYRKRPGEVQ